MDAALGNLLCDINSYIRHYEETGDWQALAWWIHDHLPYSRLVFFPKLCAFNLTWHEQPERRIESYIIPKGTLTKPGMDNHEGDRSALYQEVLVLLQSGNQNLP